MGGPPLDPDRPAPDAESADHGAASASPGPAAGDAARPGPAGPETAGPEAAGAGAAGSEAAPGLREQLFRTRDAVIALVRAHIDLAKAEAAEIAGEVKRAAALGGLAIGCAVLLAFFFPTALLLFLGEWLFGSIGWGLLHGTLLLIDVAILAGLLAAHTRGLGRAFVVAVLASIVFAIVFGAGALNALWRAAGDAANRGGDPAWRPLVVGVIVGAALFALIGLVLGARSAGVRGAIGGAIAAAVLGVFAGAFSAITFGWTAGAGVGVTIGLLVWPVAMGLGVRGEGMDTETLKARFWPQTTIDTTKETIEWAKSRTPRGPTS